MDRHGRAPAEDRARLWVYMAASALRSSRPRAVAVARVERQPRAAGDVDLGAIGHGMGLRCHGLSGALRDMRRLRPVRVGHEDDELVAAVAGHDVAGPNGSPQGAGDGPQHSVAGLVAVVIVDHA